VDQTGVLCVPNLAFDRADAAVGPAVSPINILGNSVDGIANGKRPMNAIVLLLNCRRVYAQHHSVLRKMRLASGDLRGLP
jgi:hypothetical protein